MFTYDGYAALVTAFVQFRFAGSRSAVDHLLKIRDIFDARLAYQAACVAVHQIEYIEQVHALPPSTTYADQLLLFDAAIGALIIKAVEAYHQDYLVHLIHHETIGEGSGEN